MGQTLSEPITAKDTSHIRNADYRVGSSCMQGWRLTMEDAHTHILSLPDDPGTAFFGVYDGHGGGEVADYVGKNLHKFIVNREEYRQGNIPEALKKAFLEIDEAMYQIKDIRDDQSGSTAVTVMIKGDTLYCANIGDSRAIGSIQHKLENLSWDHKPVVPEEYERINEAGGWVRCDRVNGNLALSRAFGDYTYKRSRDREPEKQIVIALPDVVEKSLTPDWDFVVLACDGIWDVMSDHNVLDYVIGSIAEGLEPEDICEKLMMHCLAPDCFGSLGCDNMTVILVVFLHGGTYEDVIEKSKSYVERKKTDQIEETDEIPKELESTQEFEAAGKLQKCIIVLLMDAQENTPTITGKLREN